MDTETHSTALNQLPNMAGIKNNMSLENTQDNDLVNEILNEIDNQNNPDQNKSTFNYQMDSKMNINQTSMPDPSPDEIQQMNVINQQNNLNNQYNEELPQQDTQVYSDIQTKPNNHNTFNMDTMLRENKQSGLLYYLKNSLLVSALVFAILLFPKNIILSKIPKTIDANGKVSLIGNGVFALLAGVVYFILTKYVM